jgi:hypothetical protein
MQEREPELPTSSPTGDYGYDMAHELGSGNVPPSAGDDGRRPAAHVATESSDLDQDYGYDLAHEIPRLLEDQRIQGS